MAGFEVTIEVLIVHKAANNRGVEALGGVRNRF
jgi:hypothetical protein